MHITFPDDQPVFDGANLTVRFTARVDGEPVECGNYRRGAGRSFRRPFRAGIRLNGCFRQRPILSVRFVRKRSTRTAAKE